MSSTTDTNPKLEINPKFFDTTKKHKQLTRVLLSLSALGLILFFLVATIAPFRDKLFQYLYPKPSSRAASATFGLTAPGSPNYPQTGPLQKLISPPYDSYGIISGILYRGADVLVDNTRGFGYYSTGYQNSSGNIAIVKFNLASFKIATALVLSNGGYPGPSAIDVASGFGYFTSYDWTNEDPPTYVTKVYKVNLANFTLENTLTISGDGFATSADIDITNHFLYLGTHLPQGIAQIDLSTFTLNNFLPNPFADAATDPLLLEAGNSFAYACNINSSNQQVINKIQLPNLTVAATLVLPGNCNQGGFIDSSNGYINYGPSFADATKIVRVRLSDFTATTSASILTSGESGIIPAGLDSSRGLAFFATNATSLSSNTKIIETNSQTLSRIGSVDMGQPSGSSSPPPMDINPPAAEIYIVNSTNTNGYYNNSLFKLSYTQSFKGFIEGSKVTLSEVAPVVSSFSFYSQTASSSGKLRLALYNSSKTLLWQSGAVPQTVNGGWQTVEVSTGTPNSLTNLPAGDYYLAWQTDSDFPTASYTQGSPGDGFELPQAFGDFPANISGETSTSSKWSLYGSYSSALIVPTPSPAPPGTLDTNLWAANDNVSAILKTSQGIYLGGDFTAVGPNTGVGVPLDGYSGVRLTNYSSLTNDSAQEASVKSTISDGNGGWYIGGSFAKVGGVDRAWVAHIKPDGSVDPGFNAQIDATYNPNNGLPTNGVVDYNDGIYSLALSPDKSTLYFGGGWWLSDTFIIAGQTRYRAAAVDAVTGALKPWAPVINDNASSGPVLALSPDGSTVYLGGTIDYINNQYHPIIAAVDSTVGNPSSWKPPIRGSSYGGVLSLAVSADGKTVYAGGNRFTTAVDGTWVGGLVKIDAVTGNLITWLDPLAVNYANSIVLSKDNSTLYFAGSSYEARYYVGAADTLSNTLKPFKIEASYNVNTISLSPDESTLYMGGSFNSVGGVGGSGIGSVTRLMLASVNLACDGTVSITPWNPTASGTILALAVNSTGTAVYAGGASNNSSSIGSGQVVPRPGLAKLKNDGSVDLTFDPDKASPSSSPVGFLPGKIPALALSKDGSILYVGGDMTKMGAETRNGLGAVNAATGALLPFNPDVSGLTSPYGGYSEGSKRSEVFTMALSPDNSTLYFGGNFASVSGQLRHNIAAVNTTTGAPTAFNPYATAFGPYGITTTTPQVNSIQLSSDGQTLYASGLFMQIGGQSLPGLAALDTSTGNATSWFPAGSDEFFGGGGPIALSADNSILYHATGTDSAGDILALNTATGNGLSFNAAILPGHYTGSVLTAHRLALSCSEDAIFLSGGFGFVGGQNRFRIAAMDTTSYNTLPWNPLVSSAGGNISPISVDCTPACSSPGTIPASSNYSVYFGGNFGTVNSLLMRNVAGVVPSCFVFSPTPAPPSTSPYPTPPSCGSPSPTPTPTPTPTPSGVPTDTPTPTPTTSTPTPTSPPAGSGGSSASNPTPTPFTPVVPLQGPKTGGR